LSTVPPFWATKQMFHSFSHRFYFGCTARDFSVHR
jgi:hypothetical protein